MTEYEKAILKAQEEIGNKGPPSMKYEEELIEAMRRDKEERVTEIAHGFVFQGGGNDYQIHSPRNDTIIPLTIHDLRTLHAILTKVLDGPC